MNDPIDLAYHPRYRPRPATAGPPVLRAARLTAMAAAIDMGPNAGCTPSEPWNDRETHP